MLISPPPLSHSLLLPCVLDAVVIVVVVMLLTHTRAHDMHTMTADCWLPKAPEAYESSTNRVKSKRASERGQRREERERERVARKGAECRSRCCHLPPSGTFYSTRRPSCCDSLMKALIWVYQLKLRGK